jgi:hypothetical protein
MALVEAPLHLCLAVVAYCVRSQAKNKEPHSTPADWISVGVTPLFHATGLWSQDPNWGSRFTYQPFPRPT